MEPGGTMPHSQGLSNNPYHAPNKPKFIVATPISLRSITTLSTHLRLGPLSVDFTHPLYGTTALEEL